MTEKQLQAAIVKTARLLGWRVYHTFDSRRSEPGFPDLCMVKDGRLVFAELKSAKGRPTEAQVAWIAALRLVPGSEAHVWWPADWSSGTVERVLREPVQEAA